MKGLSEKGCVKYFFNTFNWEMLKIFEQAGAAQGHTQEGPKNISNIYNWVDIHFLHLPF